ncbi:MAG: hypothetical protein ACI31M_00385 [Bacilli bacterium]
MKKYIIVELIPSARTKENGDIVQLSALKIDNYNVIDRFDYRLNEDKIFNYQLLDMIKYDKDSFTYCDSTDQILQLFSNWCEKLPLYIIDNDYTKSYLSDIKNKKESIIKKLNMKYSDNIIEEIILKYNLAPSNYIVDLLLEALIYESNKK